MSGKTWSKLWSVAAIALFVLSSVAVAFVVSPIATAPAARSPGPLETSLSQPIHDTPALNAAVSHVLDSTLHNTAPALRTATPSPASITSLTPDQILARAGVGNEIPLLDQATQTLDSGVHADANFASWSQYLEVAGAGCLTAGGSAVAGSITTQAFSYTTVGIGTAESGTTIGTVATKSSPAVFALTCAVGAAVALVIFQTAFEEGGAAINYENLWTGFAQGQWGAYLNYVNLTDAMFASLASLALYAQVAFDRMADNAALLQIGNATFNAANDLLNSGLAAELAGMVTDYQDQLGFDFQNVPMWLDALTAQGAGFAGYGQINIGSATIYPSTDVYSNASATAPNNGTAGGLEVDAAAASPITFLWDSLPTTQIYSTCPASSSGSCVFDLTYAKNGTLARTWTVTAATYGLARSFGFYPGLYNLSTGASSGYLGIAIVPFAAELPTLAVPSVGTFAWEDRYFVTGGTYDGGNTAGHCVWTPNVAPASWVLGDVPSFWAGSTINMNVQDIQYVLNTGGTCGAGGTSAVTPLSNIGALLSCALGGTWTLGNYCYNTASSLATTVGELEYNATLSGQTYYTFIRSLGFTSLSQIPAGCVIPAPNQDLPSQVNLGALTLNESMALYQGWLQSMGNFYGANPTFHVCGSSTGKQWNWNNSTYSFIPGTAEYGGAYLGNGTGPVNVSGYAMPSEHLGSGMTWALPYRAAGVATNAPTFVTSAETVSTAHTASVTVSVNGVLKGDTILGLYVSAQSNVLTSMGDSGSSSFAQVYVNTASTQSIYLSVWAGTAAANEASDTVSFTVGSLDYGTAVVQVWRGVVSTGCSAITGCVAKVAFVDGENTGTMAATFAGTALDGYAGLLAYNISGAAPFGADTVFPAAWKNTTYGGIATTYQGITVTTTANGTAATNPTFTWTPTAKLGGNLIVLSLKGGAIPILPTNTSLILVPTLKNVTIPLGANWPVPAGNPIWAFYATHNASQGAIDNKAGDNWTVLNLAVLYGNGTSNGTSDHNGGTRVGDTLYLTACEQNFSYLAGSCAITVTNWSVYLTKILCGNNSGCGLGCIVNCGGGGGGGSSTCGAGVFFLGPIAQDFANWFGSVPIIGGGLSAIGCAVGWVVAVGLLLVLAILAIYLGVGLARWVSSRGGD